MESIRAFGHPKIRAAETQEESGRFIALRNRVVFFGRKIRYKNLSGISNKIP